MREHVILASYSWCFSKLRNQLIRTPQSAEPYVAWEMGRSNSTVPVALFVPDRKPKVMYR